MQYSWRVPENTLSVVIREVCNAICEEYVDEVMTASSIHEEWTQLADGFLKKWNFQNCVLPSIENKLPPESLPALVPYAIIISVSSASSYWPLSTQTTNLCGVTLVVKFS